MIISNFKPFKGQHCETTATGSLLMQLGIELSEPLLFGIGEGLGYIYWNMKSMDFPFIGGRVKQDELTQNICRNLQLNVEVKETGSLKKAWKNIADEIDNGRAVGLKLDCYHLDYFTNKIHFAGHYVAMYGYDDIYAYVVDTAPQGSLMKTRLETLALARSEKGPMSSKNLSYTISMGSEEIDLPKVVSKAVQNNAYTHLNPPITNIGYKGILKTSKAIKKWFKESKDPKHEFQTTAMLMDRGGTGGALFRNMYRDFLAEAFQITENKKFQQGHLAFKEIAKWWKEVIDLLDLAGEKRDIQYIDKASKILEVLSEKERTAMADLLL